MKKVILVGYMGSGKSKIGKLLAQHCKLPFYDLDNLIEDEVKTSINQIFEEKGEIYFRKIEHQIFKNIVHSQESFILSLGGGTPCYANNHELLQAPGVISVYLNASIETLVNRLQNGIEKRPLLKNLSPTEMKDFIAKHLFDRSYFYHQSTFTISVNAKTPNQITAEIEKLF
jgi:shikimate kinase